MNIWPLIAIIALALCLVCKSIATQYHDPTTKAQPVPFAIGALGFAASGLLLIVSAIASVVA